MTRYASKSTGDSSSRLRNIFLRLYHLSWSSKCFIATAGLSHDKRGATKRVSRPRSSILLTNRVESDTAAGTHDCVMSDSMGIFLLIAYGRRVFSSKQREISRTTVFTINQTSLRLRKILGRFQKTAEINRVLTDLPYAASCLGLRTRPTASSSPPMNLSRRWMM